MHTLCGRYLLLYGRTSVHIMRSRDVLEHYWIVDVCSLSYRIGIATWRIVMLTLHKRLLPL